jgi:hypothetical protein
MARAAQWLPPFDDGTKNRRVRGNTAEGWAVTAKASCKIMPAHDVIGALLPSIVRRPLIYYERLTHN